MKEMKQKKVSKLVLALGLLALTYYVGFILLVAFR